jgi:hypothetical protein
MPAASTSATMVATVGDGVGSATGVEAATLVDGVVEATGAAVTVEVGAELT